MTCNCGTPLIHISNPHFACVEHSGYILINNLEWFNKAFPHTPKSLVIYNHFHLPYCKGPESENHVYIN